MNLYRISNRELKGVSVAAYMRQQGRWRISNRELKVKSVTDATQQHKSMHLK